MAYKFRSRRTVKRLARKSKRNFLITLILIAFLVYAAISWILPNLINGVRAIKNTISPVKKAVVETQSPILAPPIFNIPYESTNTAQMNIKGYAAPNSKVALYLDDEKKDTVNTQEDGSFEIKEIKLSLGTNNIYGKSIDEKNQESLSSKTSKIIFDNEKPTLNISGPEDNKKIQGGDKKVKIAGNTKINAQVFINGSQIIVDKDGKFESEQPLTDGDNNFNIKAVDIASNFTEVSRKVIYQP